MCRWSLALAVFVPLLGSAQEQPPVNVYSIEKEAAIGTSLATGVRKSTTAVESVVLSQYVEGIGGKLAAVLPAQGASYRFTVVENDLGGSTHEPLALPGGAIFVPANLIFDSRSEAEFAAMLAHAMAHVAARHGTRLATRAQASNLEFSPVMYSNLGSREDSDERLRNLQRSFEMEADQMTVGTLAGAGYDPEAFAAYIARQQKDDEGTWSPLLSREERVARIRTVIQQLPQSDFQRMQEELHRLLTTHRP